MRTLGSQDSKGIFRQLAAIPGASGVKTIIENHDAWLHNAAAEAEITAQIRAIALYRLRPAEVMARLAAQREALAPLVTRLPMRFSHTG